MFEIKIFVTSQNFVRLLTINNLLTKMDLEIRMFLINVQENQIFLSKQYSSLIEIPVQTQIYHPIASNVKPEE